MFCLIHAMAKEEGGGTMSYTTSCTWGRGDEGDKILKCYTFDLFTFNLNIH